MEPILIYCRFPIWIGLAAILTIGSFGCSAAEPAPTLTFPIQDLLLDPLSLPADWVLDDTPHPSVQKLGQIDSVSISFHAPGIMNVNELIYYFASAGRAGEAIDQEDALVLGSSASREPWTTPSNFHYRSPIATKARFDCQLEQSTFNKNIINQACVFAGQYNQYVYGLTVYATPARMQTIDFEKIVRAIDERMQRVK